MKHDFVVMVCYYGAELRAHRECIDELKRAGIPFLPVYDCPYLDIARSHACTQAMLQVPSATGFVFIDHDIHGFSPETVIEFVRRAREGDKRVVGAGYSLRRPGFMMACQPLEDEAITFYRPGYHRAKYVGTGFMYIARETLETLTKVYFVRRYFVHCVDRNVDMFFAPWIDETGYHPDDIGFCYRVRKGLGWDIWIDAEPRLLHRGSYDYAVEDAGLCVPNYDHVTVNFDKSQKKASV